MKQVCLIWPFTKQATQKGQSKEHCVCIKQKQNISSQSFLRNLSLFYKPYWKVWRQLKLKHSMVKVLSWQTQNITNLFLPWFACVVFIYLSLPFFSPFLLIWMKWHDNTVLIEDCGLSNVCINSATWLVLVQLHALCYSLSILIFLVAPMAANRQFEHHSCILASYNCYLFPFCVLPICYQTWYYYIHVE